MSLICFALSSAVEPQVIVGFCSKKLQIPEASFLVVEDYIQYCIEQEIDTSKTFIQYNVSSGEFDAWVVIYVKTDHYNDFNESINFLVELSRYSNTQVLTSDEYTDPFSFVLIRPSGDCVTIDVEYNSFNEKDELNFGQYENPFFGQFALKQPVELDFLKLELAKLFGDNFTEFELQTGDSGPVVNGGFDKNKIQFNALTHYQHHFDIIPKGQQKWYSIKEKTEIFSKKMIELSAKYELDICLFPADYVDVQNIEGGSDSEEYCIHCVNGQTERIIYKIRRKSWKIEKKPTWFFRLFASWKR